MSNHDVTLCKLPTCDACDAFKEGYERGKAKAYFEIEVWDNRHPPECGCTPCRIVRGIIAKALGNRPAPLGREA